MINKNLLLSKMIVNGDNNSSLAYALGISPQTLSAKKNETNGACFNQKEILAIKERYKLSANEVSSIFFAV